MNFLYPSGNNLKVLALFDYLVLYDLDFIFTRGNGKCIDYVGKKNNVFCRRPCFDMEFTIVCAAKSSIDIY